MQSDRVQQDYWIRPLDWRTLPETFGQFLMPLESGRGGAVVGLGRTRRVCRRLRVIVPGARRGDGLVLASALGPMIAAAAVSATTTPVWVPRYFRFAHLFVLAVLALAIWRPRGPRGC